MDLTLTAGEAAFRDEVYAWLEEHHPGPAPAGHEDGFEFRRRWQRSLHEGGWAGISWPKEYGGRGATLIGNGPEVMNLISMVGHDLELDSGIGMCGKEGQSVPVGVGQPTLKVDALTVGGTEA